ncbi:MAG TPA: hypothetical protein VJ888_09635 [Mobilitalea sp.]|nr:hypothetical protein [Mobilitalea sp.]
MRIRRIIIILVVIILATYIYIGLSSKVINERHYRERAWEVINQDENVLDWEKADVTLVKLKGVAVVAPSKTSAKIGRSLLLFNGGYAIQVSFSTTLDPLLGPIVVYFNPFTKQYIGSGLRF